MENLRPFDMANYLDTEELQNEYLKLVSEENDPAELIKAIQTVAKAKGMANTAKKAGITREGLYKALGENGNPGFVTVCNILNAIGYKITISKC